jgi:hypothetical protein
VLSFKDFVTVDYTQSGDEYLAYQAQKRHRGVVGEECWQGYTQKGMKPKNGRMVPNCVPESEAKEALSFQGRRALARAMKRRKSQLKISRRRAMQKTAGMDVLMKRAEKQARNQLFKKFSKDADRGDLTPQRRAEIEKKVAKAKTRVTTLARKLLPKLRQAAKDRRS